MVPFILRRRDPRGLVHSARLLFSGLALTPALFTSLTVVQAKALYSYTGTTDEEMPFTEGDVLTVVDRTDDAWWKASSGGVVFLVPASYLELSG